MSRCLSSCLCDLAFHLKSNCLSWSGSGAYARLKGTRLGYLRGMMPVCHREHTQRQIAGSVKKIAIHRATKQHSSGSLKEAFTEGYEMRDMKPASLWILSPDLHIHYQLLYGIMWIMLFTLCVVCWRAEPRIMSKKHLPSLPQQHCWIMLVTVQVREKQCWQRIQEKSVWVTQGSPTDLQLSFTVGGLSHFLGHFVDFWWCFLG